MTTDFITPMPMSIDIHYDSPRTSHITAGGSVTINYNPVNIWRGSMDFAPIADGAATAADNPMPDIAKYDKPNAGFFIDIAETGQIAVDANDNPVAPSWHDTIGTLNNTGRVLLSDTHALSATAGDLISFRHSSYPQFVTTRRIQEISSDKYAYLHTKLPAEYFAILLNSNLQYCLDRPHVRARFAESPQRWRRMPGVMHPISVQWIEDAARAIYTFREVSQIAGVPDGTLLTEDGKSLNAEDPTLVANQIGNQLVQNLLRNWDRILQERGQS